MTPVNKQTKRKLKKKKKSVKIKTGARVPYSRDALMDGERKDRGSRLQGGKGGGDT